MKTLLRLIDGISQWNARIIQWLCVLLIVVLCYEVTMRYVFNSPTVWVMQTGMMIGGAIVVLGWSYVHQQGAHVRVDVLYGRLSRRWQSLINLVGALAFFFPFVGLLTYRAGVQMLYSWNMGERMRETAWYPPAYPIRAIVFLGLALFLLQGIAVFIRDLRTLTMEKDRD